LGTPFFWFCEHWSEADKHDDNVGKILVARVYGFANLPSVSDRDIFERDCDHFLRVVFVPGVGSGVFTVTRTFRAGTDGAETVTS
jgi:hypothetical protein